MKDEALSQNRSKSKPETFRKYRPFPALHIDDRRWPSQSIVAAPRWCSVDLRDGNQALPNPMTVEQKLQMFQMLVQCGFKEIEIGFPAASETEYAFTRRLIECNLIPDDVTVQVLVQAREDLIKKTCQSLIGAKKVIIHLYNSTSPAQRRVVFGLEKPEIVALAVSGVEWIKQHSAVLCEAGTVTALQYSPESFSATEIDFSVEICEAVMDTWWSEEEVRSGKLAHSVPTDKVIINLPATVEVSMPNVYADQIEWFLRHISRRESIILSIHTHNDRGTGVAATEMALLAGADRVEGTLFGNGERTGNLDIVTVALNMHTQGIDPVLDFSDIETIRSVYEECTGMTVDPRHPYSGELVFTAFSGSHQDAIRKGLRARAETAFKAEANGASGVTANEFEIPWDVPYLAIDPKDIGRSYEPIIRINSQSGKGGVAHILESQFGFFLPKEMQKEFGPIIAGHIDSCGKEVSAEEIKKCFWSEYVESSEPFVLETFHGNDQGGEGAEFSSVANVRLKGHTIGLLGEGNGPVAAFVQSLNVSGLVRCDVLDYHAHALSKGSDAGAIAYVCIRFPDNTKYWGAGTDTSIDIAPIKAVLCAINRHEQKTSKE